MAAAVSGAVARAGWRLLQLRCRLPVSRCRAALVPRAFHASAVQLRSTDQQKQQPLPSSQQHSETRGAEEPSPESSHSPPRYTDQGGEEEEGYESEEQLQHRILTAALEFVPAHGWTAEAIAEGAKSLGLSTAAASMFGNDGSELILHFVTQCNARLTRVLEEEQKLVQLGQAEKKKTDQFLKDAVETRLRMLIPYIEHWPRALSILMLPHNIPSGLSLLTSMVDDMWHYAGDQSTDFNWYTRRAVLAGIYNTTELVMMQDSSPDFEDTWRFLENRINDAMNMGHTAKQVKSTGEALVQGLMGAAVTIPDTPLLYFSLASRDSTGSQDPAQELNRPKPASVSKQGRKLECPEENPWIYLKGFEMYEVPSTEQGVNENTQKDLSYYHSLLQTRALEDTVRAWGWDTSVHNTRPGLPMPFSTSAV